MKNQEDIGNAIKPIYGEAAGNKLAELLKDHIRVAGELLFAAKAGDSAKASDAEKRWYANADEIAAFLSGANPNWPKEALTSLLYAHLGMVKDEGVSFLKMNWPAYIEARDMGHMHMMKVADALADGIVKQFPQKFSR